jgi:serine/threonine protein kinase/formylglycine-generating enzyme required for sulfatase activity
LPETTARRYAPGVTEQETPEERYARALRALASYRQRQAAGNAEPVEDLLAAHGDLREILEAALRDTVPADRDPEPERPAAAAPLPEHIGPYKILAELGEGGMGTVYAAEQKEPVRRRVALKVIKLGMDSKAVLARFALERQALAVMNHDAIAKVFDAGTTERGQPYFALELVEGVPITRYCDDHKLDLRARIALFQQVCQGVQHAHQKGVIHRDVKPGNVLCALRGDQHVAKIIDFGVARATDHQLVQQTIFSEQGMLLGTPEYMSPEQASGNALAIDTRTDVYSLGVMLYELLAGVLPFPRDELRRAGLLEMQRKIREDEPPKPSTRITTLGAGAAGHARARRTSARALANDLRRGLDWIVLKAISKEPERRYESANGLGMDLGRYLAHEPLIAGPPGAAYRLRTLARRYRGQVIAAAIVFATAILGAVVATGFAFAEQSARKALASKVSEFDQLAGRVRYDRAVAREQELYPAWPHKIEAMERWLREDCGKLLAMCPEIERTVRSLRARALPQSEAERRQDRETHPRFAEWTRAEQRLASLRRAQAIRDGAPLVVAELTAEQQALDASALNAFAWDRVAPKTEERKVYGEEALGLGCARAAVAKASDAQRHELLDTLAWALVANGQDEEARQRSAAALAAAPAKEKTTYEGYQRDVGNAIANAQDALAAAEREHAALRAELDARRTWTFAADDEAARFLHDTLADLLGKLARLETDEKAAVEQRLSWAQRIGDLTRAHPNARMSWDTVRAAIAASPKYSGQPVELRDRDVIGLVPIGENPVSGLWEFYELRSAWDGKSDPASIPIPPHQPDGSIEVTGDTGIVFVLLPGGTFTMGAQSKNPDGPNHDAQANGNEAPVHEVTLAPFFLARHELTKGQWQRLSGGEEPSWYRIGIAYQGNPEPVGSAHAVEQIDWSDSEKLLRRHGLVLPTEAQWEYGCRAGTSTPWWPGRAASDLSDCANVLDKAGERFQPLWGRQEGDFDDGRVSLGRVGCYRANAFGLYDVHGNVWEWCLDEYGSYAGPVRAGDGLRLQGDGSSLRVNRGGSFYHPASIARSSYRYRYAVSFRIINLGLRPARASRLDD